MPKVIVIKVKKNSIFIIIKSLIGTAVVAADLELWRKKEENEIYAEKHHMHVNNRFAIIFVRGKYI